MGQNDIFPLNPNFFLFYTDFPTLLNHIQNSTWLLQSMQENGSHLHY